MLLMPDLNANVLGLGSIAVAGGSHRAKKSGGELGRFEPSSQTDDVGSDGRRQAMDWGSGAATVHIEIGDEDARSKAGIAVEAPPALPQGGETTRPGVILAECVGMASAS